MNGMIDRFAFMAALAALAVVSPLSAIEGFVSDRFDTGSGALEIIFIGHATLAFEYGGKIIHVDPVGTYADYKKWPKADLILVTHEHSDHFDKGAIADLSGAGTTVVLPEPLRSKLGSGTTLEVGKSMKVAGISVEAVPAYNTTAGRDGYHPKTRKDNGYVLSFGSFRVYVAGDTENIPEMAELKNIDAAFLPMNQPYTMTPQQVAEAAKAFRPRILYPYHFSSTDTSLLAPLLSSEKGIEVRIRDLK
jgi:L-ascorbate metabolism protein UlaG (beta-lactamase superfamily)